MINYCVMVGGYMPDSVVLELEELKELGKFDEAMRIVNSFLIKNPNNEDALLQVADIQYRNGDISKASKAIDFLNAKKNNLDPLGLYIKGVLEMEKNNWVDAKFYLQNALELVQSDNHEILRCYGLCEYWYGNREKGIDLLKEAFIMQNKDAEVIYNLIEIYMIEHNYKDAKKMILYFYKNHENLITLDKDMVYYDSKILLFEKFMKIQEKVI